MRTLWILRGVLVVHAASVAMQPVLAGSYLSGEYDALAMHQANSFVLHGACVVGFFAALAYWLGGRGRGWPALALLGLFLAEGFQVGFGYERQLAFHIPLGVTIVLSAIWLAAWSFTARARFTRPRKRTPIQRATERDDEYQQA
jgi:hypothetical protein